MSYGQNNTKNSPHGKTRVQVCLKCHKKFKTELDPKGIPWKKICPDCTEENANINQCFNGSIDFDALMNKNKGG